AKPGRRYSSTARLLAGVTRVCVGFGPDQFRTSGRATCACRAALQSATLVFAQSTPHARILVGLEGILQTLLRDGASSTYRLGLLNLVDRGSGVPHREEQ